MIGKKECALILDWLSAHRTPEILKKAAQLNIQLIFVPVNGTSYYQPLDRHIFGVLKAKLRSLSASKTLNWPQKYAIVTKYLLKTCYSYENQKIRRFYIVVIVLVFEDSFFLLWWLSLKTNCDGQRT